MKRFDISPWARAGLAAAGIDQFQLQARVPPGWRLRAYGNSVRGPYVFVLSALGEETQLRAVATSWRDVPAALDSILGSMDLETQLAASLRAIE